MCKGGLAPVAPKCRVVAADADEHEWTRSLVTQPLPSKTPPAPSLTKVESRVLPEAFVLLEGHAVTPAISRRWGNSVTGGPQPPKKSPVSLGDGAVNGHVVVGEQSWAQKPPRQRPVGRSWSVARRKSKEKTRTTRRRGLAGPSRAVDGSVHERRLIADSRQPIADSRASGA